MLSYSYSLIFIIKPVLSMNLLIATLWFAIIVSKGRGNDSLAWGATGAKGHRQVNLSSQGL